VAVKGEEGNPLTLTFQLVIIRFLDYYIGVKISVETRDVEVLGFLFGFFGILFLGLIFVSVMWCGSQKKNQRVIFLACIMDKSFV
jgi:hypothetical protein